MIKRDLAAIGFNKACCREAVASSVPCHTDLDARIRKSQHIEQACNDHELQQLGLLGRYTMMTGCSNASAMNVQGPLIVEEQVDRQILWICKYNPDLQETLSEASDSQPAADDALLEQSFEACKLGLRLVAFHVAFLKLIARPPGSSFLQVNHMNSRS